jgi:hypothetical protein
MSTNSDEKISENVAHIVDGAARIIEGVGSLFGKNNRGEPPRKDDDMGRRNHDDDDLDDLPTTEGNVSIRTELVNDSIAVIFVVGERAVKRARLTEEEAETLVKDLQKRLKGLRAQKDD